MGYYASYNGYIRFKNIPDKEIMDCLYNTLDCYSDKKDLLEVTVDGNDKYHEDEIYEVLNKIKPFVKEGELEYHGEDDYHWRFIFKDNDWVEENGEVYYESQLPLLKKGEDQAEFVGQIVDIAEDCLNDSEEVLIDNDRYDTFIEKLINMMKEWKVFPN